MTAGCVLAINSGSSSIKFALFESGMPEAVLLARGTMHDAARCGFTALDAAGTVLVETESPAGRARDALFAGLLDWVDAFCGPGRLVAVGHRIVHGGAAFCDPVVLTPACLEALDRLTPLAPLHQPRCLLPVRLIAALRPDLVQVGCFDTAFHRTIGATARRYALPWRFEAEEGIRKYGFHGLSYAHIAERLAAMGEGASRTVVAHLGSGASLCALANGESQDTSMGFSVLDGLPMATRCGSVDPGAILYLQRHLGLSAQALEDILYHQSGLLGVSGISGDLRDLVDSRDPRAIAAIELFVHHVSGQVALMANTLGGIDQLVFTGGIGEHQAKVRAGVCARLTWLGIGLDASANEHSAPCISAGGSRVSVLVIPADEERVIARQALAVQQGS